jgi:hypothetical protein
MLKSELLAALRTEIHKHDFSHFVDEPGTMAQFLDHLTDDVLPAVLDRLSAEKVGGAGRIRTDE